MMEITQVLMVTVNHVMLLVSHVTLPHLQDVLNVNQDILLNQKTPNTVPLIVQMDIMVILY
jgi:hypothetical protein